MKENFEIRSLSDCLVKVRNTTKIPKKKFQKKGKYPVISQEDELINGFWDNYDDVFRIKKPLVIFGDHTKKVKYIDFDFVKGADGIKVLQPIDELNTRFFYYQIRSLPIEDLGYARHFRLLKKRPISIPPLPEQKRIVAKLDQCFEAINKARANIERNLQNVKDLFQSKQIEIFSQKGKGWVENCLGEIATLMTGGTPSKNIKEYFKNGDIKWLVSGDIHKKEIYDCDGRITQLGYNNSNAKYLPINSVLIALNGQGKTRGTVAMLRVKATCNQSLVSIAPNDESQIKPDYIYTSLDARYNEIREITGDGGNDRRGLNMTLIRQITISFPKSIEEQKDIIKQIQKLRQNTKCLESNYLKELNALDELNKSILREAFEGKLT